MKDLRHFSPECQSRGIKESTRAGDSTRCIKVLIQDCKLDEEPLMWIIAADSTLNTNSDNAISVANL
jgi:hypothetical protein